MGLDKKKLFTKLVPTVLNLDFRSLTKISAWVKQSNKWVPYFIDKLCLRILKFLTQLFLNLSRSVQARVKNRFFYNKMVKLSEQFRSFFSSWVHYLLHIRIAWEIIWKIFMKNFLLQLFLLSNSPDNISFWTGLWRN